MGTVKTSVALALSLSLLACSGPSSGDGAQVAEATSDPIVQGPEPGASATAAPTAAPAEPPPPRPAASWAGMSTPEGVVYDAEGDRYLVSNINGKPLDADNNGFISELLPDGTTKSPKLVEGGKKATLNAPKGMAIVKNVLYVADIDAVRMFDAKTGAPKGEIKIAGASFLNDVAAGPDGKVYVTDSGLKQGASDLEPTGTDAIHVIDKGKAKPFALSKDLGRPNGVLVNDKGVWIATFGSDEIYRATAEGKKEDVTRAPKGGLDGLGLLGSDLVVSSWQGQAIYKGPVGGKLAPVVWGIKAPADFAVDTKRGRVVVPRFMDNVVEAYEIK
jgi:sugar lactone lactonase YvrE